MRKILLLLPLTVLLAACGAPEEEGEPGGPAIEVTISAPTAEPTSPVNAAIEPALAYDSTRIHMVYAQTDGVGSHDIVYNSALVGGPFTTPASILVSAGADSRNPQCAFDSTGTLHIVWEEGNAPTRDIFYATRTSGGTITSANLTNTGAADESSPRIHIDPSNRVHIVWESGGAVLYRRKTTSFGTAITLPHVSGGSTAQSPDVTTDAGERVYVIWSEQIAANRNLRILRSDDNGTNFGEVSSDGLAQRGSVIMTDPRIKGGLDGEVFMVFVGQDTGGDRAIFECRTGTGGAGFSGTQQLYTSTTGGIRSPSLAVFRRSDDNFNIMVAINDGTLTGGNVLLFCSRDNGFHFLGGPHKLSETFCQAGTCTLPVISLDDDDCVAVWMGQPAAGGVVRTFAQINKYTLPKK